MTAPQESQPSTFKWEAATDDQLVEYAEWKTADAAFALLGKARGRGGEEEPTCSPLVWNMRMNEKNIPPATLTRVEALSAEGASLDRFVAEHADDLFELTRLKRVKDIRKFFDDDSSRRAALLDDQTLNAALQNPRVVDRLLNLSRQKSEEVSRRAKVKAEGNKALDSGSAIVQTAAGDPEFRAMALHKLRALVAHLEQQQ